MQWGPRAGFLWPASVFLTQHMDQGKERYLFVHLLPYFIRFSFWKTLRWIKISTYIVGMHCFIFKDSCHYFFAGAQEDCIFLSQRDRHRHPDKTHWSLWGYSQIHRVCYPFKNRTLSFLYSNKNDFICKLNTFWYLQTCFSILQNIF